MKASTFDVAVVGGGLAGCSAAIHLARQGLRVILLEVKRYPHHKVCGEFLSPECANLLDELGVMPALRALKPTALDTARIILADGTTWTTRFPSAGIGVSRYALDALLAEQSGACGVEVRDSTAVTGINGDLAEGFRLQTRSEAGEASVRAKVVIGAHGKRSSIDRALNRRFLRTAQPFVGLKNHFCGPPVQGRVDLFSFPGGYCGLSEVEGGVANVCLLARQDVFQKAGGDIPRFIGWMRAQNPLLGEWLSQAAPLYERWLSIAQVPFLAKLPVENDVLMAGDSAGLIAPLAGDGMSMALGGGKLAAQYAGQFLTGMLSVEDVRRGYARDWRREYGGRLALGRTLQAVMLRPRLLKLGVGMMQVVPALGDYFVTHTRDRTLVHE
jgi:menaquinone-9 beta-reductase